VGIKDELKRVEFLAKRFDVRGVLVQTQATASLECCVFALWNSLYHLFMDWRLVLIVGYIGRSTKSCGLLDSIDSIQLEFFVPRWGSSSGRGM
jgi:hypothetical protein